MTATSHTTSPKAHTIPKKKARRGHWARNPSGNGRYWVSETQATVHVGRKPKPAAMRPQERQRSKVQVIAQGAQQAGTGSARVGRAVAIASVRVAREARVEYQTAKHSRKVARLLAADGVHQGASTVYLAELEPDPTKREKLVDDDLRMMQSRTREERRREQRQLRRIGHQIMSAYATGKRLNDWDNETKARLVRFIERPPDHFVPFGEFWTRKPASGKAAAAKAKARKLNEREQEGQAIFDAVAQWRVAQAMRGHENTEWCRERERPLRSIQTAAAARARTATDADEADRAREISEELEELMRVNGPMPITINGVLHDGTGDSGARKRGRKATPQTPAELFDALGGRA